MANPALFRKIDKAVYEYGLIQNGDKILVGASGRKGVLFHAKISGNSLHSSVLHR